MPNIITQIETADSVQDGIVRISLKTIVTEPHDNWPDTLLKLEHMYEVMKTEATGIAKVSNKQDARECLDFYISDIAAAVFYFANDGDLASVELVYENGCKRLAQWMRDYRS